MDRISDEHFVTVGQELKAGYREEGLWTRAFALENGDENKTKALYIRLRVEQLSKLDNSKQPQEGFPSLPLSQPAGHSRLEKPPSSLKKISTILLIVVVGIVLIKSLPSLNRGHKPSELTSPNTSRPETPAPLPQTSVDPVKLAQNGVTFSVIDQSVLVNISGEITAGMATAVERLFASDVIKNIGERLLLVSLNSRGGDLYAAMSIGRILRHHGESYLRVAQNDECYSSCVFIFAAGTTREYLGRIGIHRPYNQTPSGDAHANESWFAKVSSDAKQYLREMRIRESLYDDMVAIPPSNIYVFKGQPDLDKYGLLQYDPVQEEINAARLMKRYGITDRQVFNERWKRVDSVCAYIQDPQKSIECLEKSMRGEY